MKWLLAACIILVLLLRFPQVLEFLIRIVDLWSVFFILALVIGVIMVKTRG